MTIQECYKAMGGDYQDVMSRLGTEERTLKFLTKFLSDNSYDRVCESMEQKSIEEAFRAIHTLKGICLNLGLSKLANSSSRLTDELRGKTFGANAETLFQEVQEDYRLVIQSIQQMING